MALHSYSEEYGSFPPAYIADENGKPLHSWRVLILPFLDEGELFEQYRFDEPWNGPNNSKLGAKIPSVFRCPSFVNYQRHHGLETSATTQVTNYVVVAEEHSAFPGEAPVAIRDISDGTTNTFAVCETRQHSVHWMQPEDVTESELVFDLHSAVYDDQANHIHGLQCLFADGSVRFIASDISQKRFHAMITRNGRDSIDLD